MSLITVGAGDLLYGVSLLDSYADYRKVEAPSYSSLCIPQLASFNIGPAALELTVSRIDGFRQTATVVEDEDSPTTYALDTALTLLRNAQPMLPLSVAASRIEEFEGDLLVHWDFGDRGITLISPSDGTRRPKLYTETRSGVSAIRSDMIEDPTAVQVATQVQWLLEKQA
jgi:hypothetical protein